MSSIVVSGDTSGAVTLSAPAVAGTVTVTLPAASGTMASLASVTANGVTYVNSSSQPTSGSALVFDGTNLLVGTTSAISKLTVQGSSDVRATVNESSASVRMDTLAQSGGQGGIGTQSNHRFFFMTNGTERATIDTSGNLLVGTTSSSGAGASAGLQVINFNGAAGNGLYMSDTRTSAGNDNAIVFGRGATYVGKIETSLTDTSYLTASDYRLKNVTGNLTGYKERLMSLQPKQGTWIVDGSEFRGFLAHDFAGLYPKSVSGEKDAVDANGKPMMQGMQASSSEVMADLVALIQEQQALITQLTARITALEGA